MDGGSVIVPEGTEMSESEGDDAIGRILSLRSKRIMVAGTCSDRINGLAVHSDCRTSAFEVNPSSAQAQKVRRSSAAGGLPHSLDSMPTSLRRVGEQLDMLKEPARRPQNAPRVL